MTRLGFAWLKLRDGSALYVNPWTVRSLAPSAADNRTLITFTNGDFEIVDGDVQKITIYLEDVCREQ